MREKERDDPFPVFIYVKVCFAFYYFAFFWGARPLNSPAPLCFDNTDLKPKQKQKHKKGREEEAKGWKKKKH